MYAAESSSSQSITSMSGSGALSHAYIEYPPFRCNIPGAMGLMYDDGSRLLIVPSPNKVFSWPVGRHPRSDSPNITAIDNGPVLSARFSLDGKVLAIQRSDNEIVYFNREQGLKFTQPCKSRTERILGFFWTDCPACDIVYVTSSGLELYSLSSGVDCLKLVDVKLSNVSWFVYTHESRLVLLSSGMQCKTFLGYQFSAGGIIRLPKFDVSMTKAEANKKPVLAPEDVRIATMYGRLYCLQVDRVAMELNIYRFYRDAVVPQGSLPIYSERVATSVVDGVLLVHQISSKVVLLFDILSDMKTPISAPLPLLLRGFSGLPTQSNHSSPIYISGSSISGDGEALTSSESTIYGDGWAFVNPDIILDHANGLLWRIHLDLEAIAASSSEIPSLLAFLQRRRLDVTKAKQLSIRVLRSTIAEKRSLSLIAEAMNVITLAYSQSLKSSSSSVRKQSTLKSPRPVSTEGQLSSESVLGGSSSTLVSDNESVTSDVLERSYVPDHNQRADAIGRRDHESNLVGVSIGAKNTSHEAQEDSNDVEINSESEIIRDGTRPADSPTQNTAHQKISTIGNLQQGTRKLSLNSGAQSSSQKLPAEQALQKIAMQSEKPTDNLVQTSGAAVAAISPDEMHYFVFSPIEEEMAVDSTFLLSAIIEYIRSAAVGKLKVPAGLQALVIQLLARDFRYPEIWHFIYNKVIEPSREVAIQLLEAGKAHPPTSKLGMDMLKQLLAHADYISLLLQKDRLLEALRYARQNRVEAVPPSTFLESAAATKDAQKLACVLRFCLDFVPNFEQTPEYSSYVAVLKQHQVSVMG